MDDRDETNKLDTAYSHLPNSGIVDLENVTNRSAPLSSLENHYSNHMNFEDNDSTSSSSRSTTSLIAFAMERGESSRLAAVFLLVNATLGAGLLNFPKAFDQAGGISVGLVIQLLLVACVCVSLLVLVHSSSLLTPASSTLQDTVATICGAKGSKYCSILIAVYCFGTCVLFLVIIGDQFDKVLMSIAGPTFCHIWFMDRHFTIVASAVILILPLCYSRQIDSLKYASSVGVLAVLYVVGLVVVQYYTGGFVPGPIKTRPDYWTDIFYVVPVICFAYQCQISVVPTYYCMYDRQMSSCRVVMISTLVLCTLAYGLTGVYGYLTFGGRVSSDVLESYDGTNIAVLAGVVAIAIKSVTTYPIMLFCGREAVVKVYRGWAHDWDPLRELGRRVFISTGFFVTTVILAVFIPDIGIVIDALGILAAVFIFIIPGLCLMQNCLLQDCTLISGRSRWNVSGAILFTSTGAFILGVVLMQTLERLAANETSPPLCT